MGFEFSHVKQFAETSKDLYEAMKEYAKNYNESKKDSIKAFSVHPQEEMEKLINKAYTKKIVELSHYEMPTTSDKTSMLRYANIPDVKYFAAMIRDIMIDMILPDTMLTGSLPYYAQIDFADLGSTISYDIENNQLFTVSKAGYRQRRGDLQKLYKTTVTMSGINHNITVGDNLFNILTGYSSIAKDVMKAAMSIETAMYFDAYDAFDTAMNNLTGNLVVANYSETSVISACEKVTAYNQQRKAVVLGTPVALKSLLPSNSNYRYLLDDEYVKLGHLQTFNGYDVIPMENVANPYNTTSPYSMKLDDTKIFIVSPASDKLVKLGVFGGTFTHTDDTYANANKNQFTTTEKAWEACVATNSVGAIVKSLN